MADEESVRALRRFFEDPNVRFPLKPRLVEDVGTYQMPEGLGFHFRGGPTHAVIRGREAEKTLVFLLPALDGTREIEDLLDLCPPDISRATLLKALYFLHTKGLLSDTQPGTHAQVYGQPGLADETLRRQLLFWGRKLGVTGHSSGSREVQLKLESADILLVGTGLFGTMTADLLVRSGCSRLRIITWDDSGLLADSLGSTPHQSQLTLHLKDASVDEVSAAVRQFVGMADLMVTATRNAPTRLFQSLNRICLDVSCPLLCADEDGAEVVVGPHITPYSSACYTCMQMRRESARELTLEDHFYQEHLAEERKGGFSSPLGEAVPFATLASSIVASEVVRIITGIAPPTLLNGQLTVPLLGGRFHFNSILRVPRCPDCRRGGRIPSS